MHADAPIGPRRFLEAVALDGQAAHQYEAAAAQHFLAQFLDRPAEFRQGKFRLADGHDVAAAGRRQRRVQFRLLGVGDAIDPGVGFFQVGTIPGGRAGNGTGRQGCLGRGAACFSHSLHGSSSYFCF
jgi:hypothetical protein